MKIITICNSKGGVAKTTSCLCIGAELIKKGYKVLYIDTDGQANLSYCLSDATDLQAKGVYELLTSNKEDINELIQHTPNGDILVGNDRLNAINLSNKDNRLIVLKEKLKALKPVYDYVLIDTPPHLSDLQVNSIVACDYVLITTQAEYGSVQGLIRTLENIEELRSITKQDIKVLGAFLTFYSPRIKVYEYLRGKIKEICKEHNTTLLNTYIRRNVALSESQYMLKPITDYKQSNGHKDYLRLTEEIIKKLKK